MRLVFPYLAGGHVRHRAMGLDGLQLIQAPVQLLQRLNRHSEKCLIWEENAEDDNFYRILVLPPSDVVSGLEELMFWLDCCKFWLVVVVVVVVVVVWCWTAPTPGWLIVVVVVFLRDLEHVRLSDCQTGSVSANVKHVVLWSRVKE